VPRGLVGVEGRHSEASESVERALTVKIGLCAGTVTAELPQRLSESP
jgi:hypothetical protein